MGIFSNNRYVGSTVEVGVNENYNSTTACVQAMIENEQNNQIFFEQLIGLDFREAQAIREGASLEVISEGAIGDFFEKVKQVLKTVCEKIKGVFSAFLARLRGVVMRDNKAFLSKYKGTVLKKDLSKMKFKWSKPVNFDKITTKKDLSEISSHIVSDMNGVLNKSSKELDKIQENINDGENFEVLAKVYIDTACSAKEFPKEFHDYVFEEVEEMDGVSQEILSEIMNILSNDKLISGIQKQAKAIDKLYNNVLKQLDKATTVIAKDIPSMSDNKRSIDITAREDKSTLSYTKDAGNADKAMKQAVTCSKIISEAQKFSAMYTNETIKACKFHISQCRKVFAKAVAFNPKSVKESSVFAEAFGSAEAYDVLALME